MGLLDRAKSMLGVTGEAKSATDIVEQLDAAKNEQELFAFVKNKIEQVRSSASRTAHEGVWMQNCAYVVGFAGVFFNSATRTFQPINRSSGYLRRQRLHVNKLLPNLQNRLAKMTKNPPRFEIRPNDNTQEAKDNARLKQDILIAKWDELAINLERQKLLMWVQQCGHAYFGVFWDDTAGELVNDPETGELMFEGDVRVETISPFEVYPDPLASDFKDCQYFIRAKIRPLSYFKDRYGEAGARVKEEETWLMSLQFETRINSMNQRGFSSGTADLMQRDTAIELTYFEKPSPRHPRGRMIVGACGVILKEGELPTGRIPLQKFSDIKVAGKYYDEAVVTHARPIQDQYNQVIRRRADWVNRMLAGKFVSPRGNELIREALTDENAEIVQYTPVPNAPNGGEPHALDIPMIPQYAYKETEELEADLAEVFGISEISKGQLPAAGIPALGMQILVEADDTRAGVMVLSHEFGYAKLGGCILDYIQQYYVTPRKMKFAGKGAYVIKDVSGDMLDGSNDVTVIPGSTIPGSKALRRQEIINAYTQGFLGDPADTVVRQQVLGMLELGDVGEVFLDHSLNNHRVKYEIDFIEKGEMPDIDEGFDHPYHVKELNRYRKSEKWESLGQVSREIFLAVREEHLRFLAELSGAVPAGAEEQAQAGEIMNEAAAAQIPADADISEPAVAEPEMSSEPIPQELATGGL